MFLSEVVGTAMLLLLGAGVVANTALTKSKGQGTGFLFVNWGWGLAVFAGVLVSQKSGAHLNPAVTLGCAIAKRVDALVVTMGGDGSVIHAGGRTLHVPPARAEAIVDPTGCGDAR